jgi:hypothetical protein
LAVARTRSRRSVDNWSGRLYALEMVVRETFSSAASEARVARRLGVGLRDMLPDVSGFAAAPLLLGQTAAGRATADCVARVVVHTISHTPQAMVTMTKLGGKLKIADKARPTHTDASPITVEMAIAPTG